MDAVGPDTMAHETDRHQLDELLERARALANDGRYDESIGALLDAEQQYLTQVHGVADEGYLADLWVLRGMTQYRRGYGASAALDLDAGVRTHGDLVAAGAPVSARMALAKSLALNASVLQVYGDPDLAAGSADAAVGLFLQHADRLDDGPPEATNAHHLCLAARIAGDLHAAAGRIDVAIQADEIGLRTADRLADSDVADDEKLLVEAMTRKAIRLRAAGRTEEAAPLFRSAFAADLRLANAVADRLSAPPALTLGQALVAAADRLGRPASYDDLVALTKPSPEGPAAISSHRCDLESTPVRARELAGLALAMLPGDSRVGLRLGLEAHYLFALGSRYGARAMRFQLAEFGTVWARLLIDLSEAFERAAEAQLAMDMAAWAGGLANSLLPYAVDVRTRELAAACIERHGRLLMATGDPERAAEALAAAARLRR
jgi:tetratricopeptide (TPR) repeat protein